METAEKTSPEARSRILDLTSILVFEGVSAKTLSLITEDCVRLFYHGDEIVHEGDGGEDLIILLHGRAHVSSGGTHLVSRGTGEIIGEQAIIEGKPRSATVVAEGMVKALILPPPIFQRLLQDVMFVRNIAKALSLKLRQATSERAVRYRNEERLFSEFSAHVAPEVASRLLATGNRYGDPRFVEAVILIADIRSFTEKCARLDPQQIAVDLSHYLDGMVEVIHRYGGLVDKFIGDAVLAVWGVIPHDGNLAVKALGCAGEMVSHASASRFAGEPIRIGVGLTQGRVFSGNVGGKGKRQFTVLGSPVNLAARLESETALLGEKIVADQGFYNGLPETYRQHVRCHEGRSIKGFEKMSVYSWDAEMAVELTAPKKGDNP